MSITLLIIILTGLASVYSFSKPEYIQKFKHFPVAEKRNKEYFRMLTGGFLHGDYMHLGVNMFVLYIFGEYIESAFASVFGSIPGRVIYFCIYLLIIVLANFATYLRHQDNALFSSIGASGAVSGMLFIYILLDPWSSLYIWGILPIKGILFGVLYLAYSSYASKKAGGYIDHEAHFYGAVFGIVLAIIVQPSWAGRFVRILIEEAPF